MLYIEIACKSIIIYIFMVTAIRLFGKKELSQLSVIDLVFILLISNSVQNAMVGSDTSVQGGVSAALGLFLCNSIFRFFLRKSSSFNKLVQGEPIVLVHNGVALKKGLKAAGMTLSEVIMTAREHGVKTIKEVNLIVLEVDGNLSVLSNDFKSRTITKRRKKVQLQHNP